MAMTLCPCGSGVEAASCCERIIAGTPARTAVELMRARYTAFVTGRMNGPFVRNTTAPEKRGKEPNGSSPQIGGMGLEVRRLTEGGPDDETGTVEFVARLSVQGRTEIHHEVSRFRREAGHWVYIDGTFPTAKVGRNDPCPCGSGKKFKQCCGK
jgi:SEC-C motif-containing protein